jgi:MotA/TolQ/ExbB proton channel family
MIETGSADIVNSIWTSTLMVMIVPLLGGLAAAVGAIAWARIRKSGGKLRGAPLALSAVAIGGLLVVASPFLLAATHRANMQSVAASQESGSEVREAARAESNAPTAGASPAPDQGYHEARSPNLWVAIRSMGLMGLLVIVVCFAVLVSILVGAIFEKLVWLPAVGGLCGMLAGVLGTVIGMTMAFSKIAELGGAANPADLSHGVSMSLVTSYMGLGALVFGILGTAGLAVFHSIRRKLAAA